MEQLPRKARLSNLGPLRREDMRLRVNVITAQVEGVEEEERKKIRKGIANRCSTTIKQILLV